MDIQEQRVQFVVAANRREKSLTALCQEFGISRPTGTLPAGGVGGDRRTQAASPAESRAHSREAGTARGGGAAALSRLGRAQTASCTGSREGGADA